MHKLEYIKWHHIFLIFFFFNKLHNLVNDASLNKVFNRLLAD